jgi:hypothetical protein
MVSEQKGEQPKARVFGLFAHTFFHLSNLFPDLISQLGICRFAFLGL